MATNPKLEFYCFELAPKNEDEEKTFKDFIIDELGGRRSHSDHQLFIRCYDYFVKQLSGEHAKDDKLKKRVKLEKKNNKHYSKRPSASAENYIISGVINGGPYGRDGLISKSDDDNDNDPLKETNTILSYFYFLAYLPLDYDKGFFMIHSNSNDDSITRVFKGFITKIFKGKYYNTARPSSYCPQIFKDDFKEGAVLGTVQFQNTFVENTFSTNESYYDFGAYDIKIIATPKNKSVPAEAAPGFFEILRKKSFVFRDKNINLEEFEKANYTTKNKKSKTERTFEWNKSDHDFVPVVQLKNRINSFYPDGTPDFVELHQFCIDIFHNEIIGEIRPDSYVAKLI
ncbi:hypothetical protein [Telluribacter sp.]|jgi:hypothetical protein|uniref:hypothetical protein n=1 Tax=Telluribacter sp. TaxID=1978767 RepID=UPI002E1542AE|nr:hypothetical protein [Telluribacter sp.]